MSTIIHAYTEIRVNNEWIATEKDSFVEELPNRFGWKEATMESIAIAKNYPFYGLLVDGARASYPWSFTAKGMPVDSSEEIRSLCDTLGFEAFGHSHLTLKELVEKYLELLVGGKEAKAQLADLRDLIYNLMGLTKKHDIEDHNKVRVVFWFFEAAEEKGEASLPW